MSMEAAANERSKLEQKDRSQLMAIVDQMGGKAGSRAKKADLIDQILELAGVTVTPSSSSSSPAATGETPKPRNGRGPRSSAKTGELQLNGKGEPPVEGEGGSPVDAKSGTVAPTGPPPAPATEADPTPDPGPGSSDRQTLFESLGAAASSPPRDAERRADAPDAPASPDAADADKAPESAAAGDTDSARNRNGNDNGATVSAPSTSRPTDDKPGERGEKHARSGGSSSGGASGEGRGETPTSGNGAGTSSGGGSGSGSGGQNQQHNQQQRDGGQNQEGDGNRRRRRNRNRDRSRDRDRDGQGQGQGQGQGDENFSGEPVDVEGYLDLRDEGYGFLRVRGYLPSRDDAYISTKQVRQFGLRRGDFVKGASRPASRSEKNPALLRIDKVNGFDPDVARERPHFDRLTALFPDERLTMERSDDPGNMTCRIIDLMCPIGKGQRGLIVSPPKAGKTSVMKEIARSIELNNPEVHLIVLLVDERPEEVTDMKRWLLKGEVASSTFDRPSDEHTQVAELTIERAKRMVEAGMDVCIILDGITRLARAYNLAAPATGRIMSGGVDSGALYPPKKFFGAARKCEEGGSLTILATALVETGSRMDEVIFEEFKGTGNMELRLDRRMAERRIYPAIDVDASSTRQEHLLFERSQLQLVWMLRRGLSALSGDGAAPGKDLEMLIDRLKTFRTNQEFLATAPKSGPM